MTRIVIRLFLSAGVVIMVVAVVWWWITFREVVQYAYLSPAEAGLCLFGRFDICDLARSLCRGAHPASIAGYWWGTFWIGVVVASASLTMTGARQA
jgi:hypothetical protein